VDANKPAFRNGQVSDDPRFAAIGGFPDVPKACGEKNIVVQREKVVEAFAIGRRQRLPLFRAEIAVVTPTIGLGFVLVFEAIVAGVARRAIAATVHKFLVSIAAAIVAARVFALPKSSRAKRKKND
jgi:hypothetical protein